MTPTPHPLTERFAGMITWFTGVMAFEAARRQVDGPVCTAAWRRMRQFGRRFAALVEMWQAGTLPAVRARRQLVAKAAAAAPRPPGPLPWRNWFRRLFPDTAPAFAGALCYLLETNPQMRELAAATPRLGRLVRPMCRMLNLKPPAYLQLPPRPRRPRPPRPRRPLTQAQHDARVSRLGRLAYAKLINPNDPDPLGIRPPNRIGYGRPKPFPKPDSAG